MEAEGCKILKTDEKEGFNLLGELHFEDIGNGRLRCLDTGHELPSKDADSYICSKKCRVALIDNALSGKIAPLNFFKQSPLDKKKLICKLTGDIINKTEEHIWKHINGRKFLKKLDEKEAGKEEKKLENGSKIRINVKKPKIVKSGRSDSTPDVDSNSKSDSEELNIVKNGSKLKKIRTTVKKQKIVKSGRSDSTPDVDPNSKSDSEDPDIMKNGSKLKKIKTTVKKQKLVKSGRSDSTTDVDPNCKSNSEELDFWIPPVGSRRDVDDVNASDEEYSSGLGGAEDITEAITHRTKRMSVAVGPSSFASQKKKIRKNNDVSLVNGEQP